MSWGWGRLEREGKEWRDRDREKEIPQAYSPADLKCVFSRAIFSVRKWAKVSRNTAENRKNKNKIK